MRKVIVILTVSCIIPSIQLFSQTIKFQEDTISISETKAPVVVMVNIDVSSIPTDPFKVVVKSTRLGDASNLDYVFANHDSLVLYAAPNSSSVLSFPITILPDEQVDDKEKIILYLYYHKIISARDSIIKDSLTVIINDFQPKKRNEDPSIEYLRRFYYKDTTLISSIKSTGGDYDFKICKLTDTIPVCKSEIISEAISHSEFSSLFKRYFLKLVVPDLKDDASIIQGFADSMYYGWKGKAAANANERAEDASDQRINRIVNGLNARLDSLLRGRDTAKADIIAVLGKTALFKRSFTVKTKKDVDSVKLLPRPQDPLFDSSKAYKYTPDYNSVDSVNIDSISIRIENGYITSLVIYPRNDSHNMKDLKLSRLTVIRKFIDLRSAREAAENLNLYLPLESQYRYYNYKIKGEGDKGRLSSKRLAANRTHEPPIDNIFSHYYIYLPDILKYAPRIDSLSDVLLHIKDMNLGFGSNSTKSIILEDKDFSSFAQVNIFTDLVGLAEDKPNGLLQAEGKFEIGLFTQPLGNSRYYSRSRWNLLHSLTFSAAITKIENKLKYLYVSHDSVQLYNRVSKLYDTTVKAKSIKTIDLIQYRNLDVSLKLNIVKFESDFTSIVLYAGVGINRIPINDTTHGVDSQGKEIISDNKQIYSALKTTGGIKIKNKITSKLGAEWGFDFIHISLRSDKFKQTYNYYSYDSTKTLVRQQKTKPAFEFQTLMPHFLIYYNIDKDLTKRIYVRSAYNYSAKSKTDNFFSFLVGYSTDMKGIFKIFSKDDQ